MENQPITFPEWKTALAQADLGPAVRAAYLREILSFLKHCKQGQAPATVAYVRQYLAKREKTASGPMREALRWFFRAAQVAMTHGPEKAAGLRPASRFLRPMEPKPAAQDLGGPDWERALVKTMRLRGLLWRTEQTYRKWGHRFSAFIAPKSPDAAGTEEVAAFLTDLAVKTRASPSGQRQALNALVFLMQEALGRNLGELDFKRAYPRERVPIVLTKDECRGLFSRLEGTTRLMAELMYGSGLRLMELLRLRVQHLDLVRAQLTVRGGKGDKDRITIIPQSLVPALERQFERLRQLHAEDRAAGLPAVWLPDGLEKNSSEPGNAGSGSGFSRRAKRVATPPPE